MHANFQLLKFIFVGDIFFSKIRFENRNILADFDKMDNLRVKKSKKTKFQKLLNKIFELPQYLPPKAKFAFLNV